MGRRTQPSSPEAWILEDVVALVDARDTPRAKRGPYKPRTPKQRPARPLRRAAGLAAARAGLRPLGAGPDRSGRAELAAAGDAALPWRGGAAGLGRAAALGRGASRSRAPSGREYRGGGAGAG